MKKLEPSIIRAEGYVAPEAELIDIAPEGTLCVSNEDLTETDGEW